MWMTHKSRWGWLTCDAEDDSHVAVRVTHMSRWGWLTCNGEGDSHVTVRVTHMSRCGQLTCHAEGEWLGERQQARVSWAGGAPDVSSVVVWRQQQRQPGLADVLNTWPLCDRRRLSIVASAMFTMANSWRWQHKNVSRANAEFASSLTADEESDIQIIPVKTTNTRTMRISGQLLNYLKSRTTRRWGSKTMFGAVLQTVRYLLGYLEYLLNN